MPALAYRYLCNQKIKVYRSLPGCIERPFRPFHFSTYCWHMDRRRLHCGDGPGCLHPRCQRPLVSGGYMDCYVCTYLLLGKILEGRKTYSILDVIGSLYDKKTTKLAGILQLIFCLILLPLPITACLCQ